MSEEIINESQAPVNEDNTEVPAIESQTPSKTFTQVELDKIVADRVAREKKKLDKFADYDDVKTKASEYEKLLEEKRLAELSEKERLEEIAKKHEEEKLSLSKELESMRESVKAAKIRSEFNQVATSNQVAHLDDAFTLADLSAVTIDEDGKVVGMDDAIRALVDNKPFLLTKKQPKPIGESTNGNTERADKTADQLLKDAATKAKASGRIEDKMAYAALKAELNK
ncbi:hypothetical protein NGI46_07855 [Peribacillus butanolivorans]|uniref:phage scaffolding protein n=1 Tax=Peribacillus butanolivorans TaxID=421767 RepID=UPI00207C6AE9|nr:hypothetical protein [Peribacillus butanolivorans]MCO0597380.1 hypothetical protein [Peribacillus butanolivorans]